MKKFIMLLAFVALNTAAFAQKEIDFKVEYKPKSTYVQKMSMDMDMAVTQLGEDGEEGETFNQEMPMAFTYTLKTEAAEKNGSIPFIAQIKMESDMVPDMGDKGNSKISGKLVNGQIDGASIKVLEGDAEVSEKLKDALGNLFTQFPAKSVKLKVGDTYKTNKIPMDLGVSLGENTDTSITYTLKKIEGKNAYFDLVLETPIDLTTQGVAVKGTMKMTGTMVYETEAKYVSSQVMDMIANFNMDQGGMKMKMDMTAKNTINTTVTPN